MTEFFDIPIPAEERARCSALPFRLPSKYTYILDGFKWAVAEKNTSAILLFDGKSGRGKTTLSCQTGVYCDANFSLAQVYFTPEDFLDGLTTAKPGSFHLFDEAMLLSNRTALSRVNTAIIQAMSMIRSKKIIVAFCVNSIFDLDKNLALHRSEILLHVYGDSLTDRGKFMAFFQGADGCDKLKQLYISGKKNYDYGFPKSNFNTSFSGYFPFDENDYEQIKQKNVNTFLQSCLTKENTAKSQLSRDSYVLWIIKHHPELNLKDIGNIGWLSTRTISNIIAKNRMSQNG